MLAVVRFTADVFAAVTTYLDLMVAQFEPCEHTVTITGPVA
jgi:hypothetical protein